jgi:hypothetical protein
MTAGLRPPGYYEQHYEALRREALESADRRGHGLTLLLTRGMVAWMKALAALQSSPNASMPSCDLGGVPSRVGLTGTWRGELTHLLAGMILVCHEESHA